MMKIMDEMGERQELRDERRRKERKQVSEWDKTRQDKRRSKSRQRRRVRFGSGGWRLETGTG